jgi:5-methylcytosine-specific restriction endonuclease McrA
VPVRSCKLFQSTAEHLIARSDGGSDAPKNIVAACYFCNSSRHKAAKPKRWRDFQAYVSQRVQRGRWNTRLLDLGGGE